MKKILLATLLIAACNTVFANFAHIGGWRWRKDDGSETTATWSAAQNTSIVINNTTDNIRLRLIMYNGSTTETVDLSNTELKDSTDGVPGWHHVSATVVDDNPFTFNPSTFVSDNSATTKQLTYTGTFEAGKVLTFSDYMPADEIGNGGYTEYEFCIKPTSFIQPNKRYFFKLDAMADLAGSETYPVLSTSADILPVRFASFTAQSLGQTVKLQWVTATEQNNDRFDILRSADGKTNWQVISSVTGKGNSNQAVTYTYTDNNPLNGNNHYRLKQYDLDGKFTESDIRSLAMKLSKGLLNVFPNPAKGMINFTLQDYKGGNLSVFLTDMGGKTIHKETITANSNNSYKLSFKTAPAPGLYILHVKGDGLDKSIQVVMQ